MNPKEQLEGLVDDIGALRSLNFVNGDTVARWHSALEDILARLREPASELSSGDKRLTPPVKPLAEAQAQAQGGGEPYCYVLAGMRETATGEVNFLCNRERQTDADIPLYTAPPSAPVGVEDVVERMKDKVFPHHECPAESAAVWNTALYEMQRTLAQQPASDGGFTAADMMDARQEGRKEAQQPAAVDGALSRDELDLCRQWFDSVQDTNGGYLSPPDYVLAAKLYRVLGMRVPQSISRIAAQPGGSDNDR